MGYSNIYFYIFYVPLTCLAELCLALLFIEKMLKESSGLRLSFVNIKFIFTPIFQALLELVLLLGESFDWSYNCLLHLWSEKSEDFLATQKKYKENRNQTERAK